MRSLAAVAWLTLVSARRRLLLVGGFASIFLLSALVTRLLAGQGDHMEPDALFRIGGFPLVSAVLLLGWVVGRFPVFATLILLAGVFSSDLASGRARLYAVRPQPLVSIYGVRLALLAGLAFGISVLLMPAFDVILLGRWAGPATLVLIAAYVLVYAGVVAFLSVLTRGDAWIAAGLAVLALLWATMRGAGLLTAVPPGARQFVSVVLPPQDALFALESAFADITPVPWRAFAYAAAYGIFFLVLAGVLVSRREI